MSLKRVVSVSREALDLLPVGGYSTVYSVFPGVLYLETSDEKLVEVRARNYSDGARSFLLNCEIQDKPFLNYKVGDHFIRENGFLITNYEKLECSNYSFYNPRVDIQEKPLSDLEKGLELIRLILLRDAYPGGLTPLLLKEENSHILKKASSGLVHLFKLDKKQQKTGVTLLLGLGEGLTPSGDDFLSGFILGLRIFSLSFNIFFYEFSSLSQTILTLAKNLTNKISYHFLEEAYAGLAGRFVRVMVNNLFTYDITTLETSILQVIKIGHSSGADFLTGFYFSLCFVRNYVGRRNN